jgi:hypothetical protein
MGEVLKKVRLDGAKDRYQHTLLCKGCTPAEI